MMFGKLFDDPIRLSVGIVIVAGGLYLIGRQAASDATGPLVDAAFGRDGTPYRDAVEANPSLAPVAAAGQQVNTLAGHVPERIGRWIGGKAADLRERILGISL